MQLLLLSVLFILLLSLHRMTASVRALFACTSGRKTFVLLGLVRSFVARQHWKKFPNTDYARRELATATAHPAVESQSSLKIAPSFLHLAKNIENRKSATKSSLPLLPILISKTNVPSFGASAVVGQNAIFNNNKENQNFSTGFAVSKNFSEVVAEELKKKKHVFSNNDASCKSSSLDALEAFARLGLPKETQTKGMKDLHEENSNKYAFCNALLHYALL